MKNYWLDKKKKSIITKILDTINNIRKLHWLNGNKHKQPSIINRNNKP